MNYEFIVPFSEEEFSAYVQSLLHCNLMQKPQWSKVKNAWTSVLCGMKREGESRKLSPSFFEKSVDISPPSWYIN